LNHFRGGSWGKETSANWSCVCRWWNWNISKDGP